jgi:hypothetical protein
MKVKVHGPMAGPGPLGNIISWAPNQIVEVDDTDETAIAFYRGFINAGIAEMVDEPKAKTSKATEAVTSTEAPPTAGPGSSRAAWVGYAKALGVKITEDMTRDDIVAAIES